MGLPERVADAITTHSKIVLVVLLVATVLIGSGVSMVDDDASLDQFETDSEEVAAADYISDNFTAEDRENTTAIQVIVRGDNVLSKSSLVDSLEFQQEIRANDSINETLVDDDAITGVENIIAITEIRGADADELENRSDELEADFDALNDSADELEADFEEFNDSADELEAEFDELNETADELNETADELERAGLRLERAGDRLADDVAELEADQAALETRVGSLETALNETAALQVAYEQAGTQAERDQINQSIEQEWQNATTAADLDQQQTGIFRDAGQQVRENVSADTRLEGAIEQGAQVADDPPEQAILRDALNETVGLQTAYDEAESDAERDSINQSIEQTWQDAIDDAALDPQEEGEFRAIGDEVRSLTTERNAAPDLEAAFEQGTAGVFQDEFADLEDRGDELESRGDDLEDRGERLSDRGDQLEDDFDELEAWGDDLEERADELEERGDELEDRADDLEDRGDELEARADDLEDDADDLEDADDPTLEEQLEWYEDVDDEELADAIADVLDDDDNSSSSGPLEFMSSSYEPGSTQADARMTFITQETDGTGAPEMGDFDDVAQAAQLELRDLAWAHEARGGGGDGSNPSGQPVNEYVIFGTGIITDEIDRSMIDSLTIVGPLALLFVVCALLIAYRDLVDIALGVLGILLVLVWTFGFMGWADIAFNQMFVAVPVLLIGLAIDYAIHVFMRHREQRESDGVTDTVSGSMAIALAGVGVALVWVTATTMIGFLANLISPIEPIREFGVVSAFGIFSALLIFGALVPAAKVEIDTLLERFGIDRHKRAFGTGGGRFSAVLSIGAVAARKAPLVIILCVLLVTAGGVYGATQVDTTFEEEDFLADSPPEWTTHLGPLAPGEYHAKADLEYVNENFQRDDSNAQILIRGDVTDDETLEMVHDAEREASDTSVAYILADGNADVESPLSMMEDTADDNSSFNETFTEADTTGDGIPNQGLETVYADLLAAEPNAAEVIYENEQGEFEAILLEVAIRGDADFGQTTSEMRAIADDVDSSGSDPRWEATATGDPIVNYIVEGDLFNTVLESMLVTLVAVIIFLGGAYWITGRGATLGIVTLIPVALAVSWILGSMYLLGMPFNVLTGMITSLTIGLGIAYSIHISSRYMLELERQGSVWDAMETTVTGTGGALLGSAATTVGGFGVLSFAILPVLQQFGIITALTIIYAFLASVIVLPTLLVVWTRYLGPDVSFVRQPTPRPTPASDGGEDTVGDDR